MKSWNSFHGSRRPGLTLLEVTAGLALLGSLLAGMLLAHNRHSRQIREAHKRLAAVAAADALLGQWLEKNAEAPRTGSGNAPSSGKAQLVWRTRLVESADAERLGIEIIRLEIHEHESANGTIPFTEANGLDQKPLATVEFALARPRTTVPGGDDAAAQNSP